MTAGKLYFDAKDHELLKVVNRFAERDQRTPAEEGAFFHSALHPHGIKELAVSQEIRVAYAVVHLLDTLEAGQVQDRLNALRSLYDEVLYSAGSSFRYNTGRVLIQIMKSLIRAHGNPEEQLRLAHDFRAASTGRRRTIRKFLRRYYLLEMPEEWNQVSFDHHVHDANTKGRKSPTHLIMDAWIKGIRNLNVVYYNFVEAAAVQELLQASEIMGITVHIGLEFQALFRGRYVQFIWEPRGFMDHKEMLDFLEEKPVKHLMRMGREASLFHHRYVMELRGRYNQVLRHEIGNAFGVTLDAIEEQEIYSFVGVGQTSRTHLAELVYRRFQTAFAERVEEWKAEPPSTEDGRRRAQELVDKANELTPDLIIDQWLTQEKNPDVMRPRLTEDNENLVPEVMRLLPATLIDWLTSIRTPSNVILNLCDLSVADVLELLYDCEGLITHIELFNLKNFEAGRMGDMEAISALQMAVNEGSVPALKKLIRNVIREAGCIEAPDGTDRCKVFTEILRNIPKLQSFYASKPLRARIGSDSTSRSAKVHGMGFVFPETLPEGARKSLRGAPSLRRNIPLYQEVYPTVTYFPKRHLPLGKFFTELVRKLPGLRYFGRKKLGDWELNRKVVKYCPQGNITTLGGFRRDEASLFSLNAAAPREESGPGMGYMNTTLKNVLKVVFGFALTAATFAYTQTWWVLAWFGPFLWFGITGFRNILQATLGGGGFRRTPLLRWNAYLSWSRLCDSLMYTGISVPLLELGVRILLLQDTLHVTALSSPMLFYTIMSLINGCYIAGHNLFRGLPREAVVGNLFRSVLAIPISVVYSFLFYELFYLTDMNMNYLVQGAAVISKLASDSVAAIIEGLADKAEFLRMRHWDFKAKFTQLFSSYSKLEVLLPEEDVLELLHRPKEFISTVAKEAQDLEKTIIVNSLDIMYFWMYQPRARSTLARLMENMTGEERSIFANSQLVLTRVHEVSQLFVDGMVGASFAKPLEFYLGRYEEYLRDMSELTGIDLTQYS